MEHKELRELLTENIRLKEENRKLKLKLEERNRGCKCHRPDSELIQVEEAIANAMRGREERLTAKAKVKNP